MSDYVKQVNALIKKYTTEQPELMIVKAASADGNANLNDTVGFTAFDYTVKDYLLVPNLDLPNPPADPINESGEAIFLAKGGTSVGVTVEVSLFSATGPFITLLPGSFIKAKFKNFWIRSYGYSIVDNPKFAKIVIGKHPDFNFIESSAEASRSSRQSSSTVTPRYPWYTFPLDDLSYANAYNSTANNPTTVSQGISLEGAKVLRIMAQGTGSDTFVSGDFRLWLYTGFGGLGDKWCENQNVILTPLYTSASYICFSDLPVIMPYDRAYVEARSITTSSGSGNITIYLQTWRA